MPYHAICPYCQTDNLWSHGTKCTCKKCGVVYEGATFHADIDTLKKEKFPKMIRPPTLNELLKIDKPVKYTDKHEETQRKRRNKEGQGKLF